MRAAVVVSDAGAARHGCLTERKRRVEVQLVDHGVRRRRGHVSRRNLSRRVGDTAGRRRAGRELGLQALDLVELSLQNFGVHC